MCYKFCIPHVLDLYGLPSQYAGGLLAGQIQPNGFYHHEQGYQTYLEKPTFENNSC